MVLLVLILILFDCLVRSSAFSTDMISLLVAGENVIVNNTQSVLTINEPFTFIINSNKSLKMLACYNKKNKRVMTSLQILKNLNKNVYTLMDDIVATAEMNGTWQCTLIPRFNNDAIKFELEVEVVHKNQDVAYYSRPNPVQKEQVYGQMDYNGVRNEYDYGAKGYSSNNEKGIVSQNTVQNIQSKSDYNVSHQYYVMVKNDVETTTTSTERPTTTNSSYSIQKVTSQSNKMIMIAVVIALIGIVVGALFGTVGKKIFCRKTSDGDPARSRRCTCSADAVYEELDNTPAAPAPAPVLDIAHRAPYPLPPAEREENKKYIHYDTPYDHRFDRPIAHIRK